MPEEYAFISCLLTKPELLDRVVGKIKPEYLEDEKCRTIYSAMVELVNFNIPLLHKKTKIDFVELLKISEILKIVNKSVIDGYGMYILEAHKTRRAKEILSLDDIDQMSAELDSVKALQYLEEENVDVVQEYLASVEKRYRKEPDTRNLKTGFYYLDSRIEGFRKSELIVIGARPGGGKTTLAMNMAYNIAKDGHKVLFCSLEMSKIEMFERLNKSITKINDYSDMSPEDFEKIIKVSNAIKERLKLDVYDKAGMTLEDIFFKAKQNKYEIVFVDHLSILKSSLKFKSRYEELSYITARLKVLARQLDIPVVCLCQLNRALEGRDLKAPNMADLRDSGSIEQDADKVAFIYRPEYHLKDKEPDNKDSKQHIDWEIEMERVKGRAQFIVSKNRRGWIGRVDLLFDGANYKFEEERK